MKSISLFFPLLTLVTLLAQLPALAQTVFNVHNFAGGDARYPQAGLVLSSNTLYGTGSAGGSADLGAVFKVNTDGTGFTSLHSFMGGSTGNLPLAGLVLAGNTLYGTADQGGSGGNGTVFKLNTDGTGFTTIHSFAVAEGPLFTNTDGIYPDAGLALSGSTLYGTAAGGGSSDNGTVFSVNTDGTGFATLYSFSAIKPPVAGGTNSDGSGPCGGFWSFRVTRFMERRATGAVRVMGRCSRST